MHFSADLFVANREEVPALLKHADPFSIWPRVGLEGIGIIELVILYQQLFPAENPVALLQEFVALETGVEDAPLAMLMPERLQSHLLERDVTSDEALANTWTQPDAATDLSQEEALAAISGMREIFARAAEANKPVVLLV